ncbi:MAG: pantetheine-phosphate adenylyltransferase [Dehalococcoidia bacterium]|nr:pantetheine-phosphate adenylyltransferase [Dehalococcoidia bacterium]
MIRAIYPGTFDPLTLGHLDIANRAAILFDEVIVAVYDAPPKNLLFTTQERIAMWRAAVSDSPKISVRAYTGLTVDLAVEADARVLVRGLRALSDFEYEQEMALTNKRLAPDVEAVFMMSSHDYHYLSSSRIKELWMLGKPMREMVPPHVGVALTEKFPPKG